MIADNCFLATLFCTHSSCYAVMLTHFVMLVRWHITQSLHYLFILCYAGTLTPFWLLCYLFEFCYAGTLTHYSITIVDDSHFVTLIRYHTAHLFIVVRSSCAKLLHHWMSLPTSQTFIDWDCFCKELYSCCLFLLLILTIGTLTISTLHLKLKKSSADQKL